ncbi:MAG: 3-isopropylmalate dehydratase [Lautropia sp.]
MTLARIDGRVAWVFAEDDFDVDQIVGVKNIKITDIDELAALAMQAYDPDFAKQVAPGDVLVGGRNFGYGHPHYPPMRAMRHLGIAAVIAESFSPGFWRGEISMGFPLVACPGILQAVARWDRVALDWDSALLTISRGDSTRGDASGAAAPTTITCEPLALADRGMLEHGGLTGYLKQRAADRGPLRDAGAGVGSGARH